MYIITWKRIHDQTEAIKQALGSMSASMRASHRAARAMTLFVVAFFIQWWAMALYGVWALVDEPVPQPVFHLVTTFSNIGGCLNLWVYLIIRRKELGRGERLSSEKRSKDSCARRLPHTTQNSVDMSLDDMSVSERHPRFNHTQLE